MTAATVPDRRVVATMMAHPDDAEILCGGTLLRLAASGWEVHVITSTAGDCGSATRGPEAIAAVRREEGRAAAVVFGGRYHCLEQRDANVFFSEPANRAAIDLLRQIAPTLVITHPRFDYMIDHEQTHLLARSATFAYAIPNASPLPRVEGSRVPWLYYADPLEGRDPYTGQPVQPTTLVDISAVIEDKARALACHGSQREWLRAHHGMDEYLDAMKRHSARRGRDRGTDYAEAFIQHRGHAYPDNDLLAELLG